jgi:hypothetical protein
MAELMMGHDKLGLLMVAINLFVCGDALELDKIRALEALAHAPLRHPPVARHRHKRLGTLGSLVNPPHLLAWLKRHVKFMSGKHHKQITTTNPSMPARQAPE